MSISPVISEEMTPLMRAIEEMREDVMSQEKKRKLMDQVRDKIRVKHYANACRSDGPACFGILSGQPSD